MSTKPTTKKKILALFLSLAMVLTMIPLGVFGDNARAATGADISSVPAVQNTEYGSETFTITADTRFYIVSDKNPTKTDLGNFVQLMDSEFAAKGIPSSSVLPIKYGSESGAATGDIVVKTDSSIAKTQGYKLEITSDKITVTGHDAVGAYYGLTTLLQSFVKGGTTLKAATVTDYPDVAERSAYIDCGRIYYSPDLLKSLIKTLAWNKMNTLYLDFSNNNATRFFLDKMNVTVGGTTYDITKAKPSQYLSEKDMNGIIETADQYGVQIIPTFNSPGHIGGLKSVASSLFKSATASDYDSGTGKVALNILDDQNAYDFGQAVVKLYVDYFASKGCKSFNIAADEVTDAISGCNSTAAKFVSYVNDLNSYIKNKGMTTRMFNDGMKNLTDGIDKDIIILYWTTESDRSVAKLIDAGYDVVNFNCHAGLYYAYMGSVNGAYVWNQNVQKIYAGWNPGILSCQVYHWSSSEYAYTPTETMTDYKEQPKLLGANFAVWADYAFNSNKDGTAIINADDKNVMEKIQVVGERSWSTNCTSDYSTWKSSLTTAPGGIDVSTYKIDSTKLSEASTIEAEQIEPGIKVPNKSDDNTTVVPKLQDNGSYNVSVKANDTVQLKMEGTDASFKWTSDPEDIATVDNNGIVTFTGKEGTVTITATPAVATRGDDNTYTVTFNVAENTAGDLTDVPEYKERTVSGSVTKEYVLDTDGVDAGANYLIVASDTNKALNSSGNAADVTITGNKAMIADESCVWNIPSASSNSIKCGNTTLGSIFGNNSNRTFTVADSDKANGKYSISYESSWNGRTQTNYIYYASYTYGSTVYSYWTTDSWNSQNVRLYKETQAGYVVDTSTIEALIKYANKLNSNEFTNWDNLEVDTLITAANEAMNAVKNPYETETTANNVQSAVNTAAENLYDALIKLKYKANVIITVRCVSGDTVLDTKTFKAYQNDKGTYDYNITPPTFTGYKFVSGSTRGTVDGATTLVYEYELKDSIQIPISIIDYRADGLLFDFQVGGESYDYGLVHNYDNDGSISSVNGGTLTGTSYGTRIAGTTLENTGYTSSDSYSGNYYLWGNKWSRAGMVEKTLGANGMPVYTDATVARVAQELAAGNYNSSEMASVSNHNDIIYNTFMVSSSDRSILNTDATKMSDEFSSFHSWSNISNAYDLAWYLLNTFYMEDTNMSVVNGNSLPIYGMKVDAYDRIILKTKGTDANGNTIYGLDAADGKINYDRTNKSIYEDENAESKQFYPIEGLGYDAILGDTTDKTDANGEKNEHGNGNGNFALRGEAQFVYNSGTGQYFTFSGDDDVYLYINNKLVLDLGGAHGVCTKGVNIDDVATECGLSDGDIATFTFFYMERNSDASNFKIETNLTLAERDIEVQKKAYTDASYTTELETGKISENMKPVYYDLILKNKGNVPMTNICFVDTTSENGGVSFGHGITNSNISKGSDIFELASSGSYKMYINDSNGNIKAESEKTFDSLEALSNAVADTVLEAGETLHVQFLKCNIKITENQVKSFTNTINVTAVAAGKPLSDNDIHQLYSYNADDSARTYVVDYGLPLNITGIFDESVRGKISNVSYNTKNSSVNFGDATVNENGFDTSIDYKMNKLISGAEKLVFDVTYKIGETNVNLQKTVYIIPATTVYYEDDFNSEVIQYNGKWATEGDSNTSKSSQALDKLGDSASNNYGYDSAYKTGTTYSMGSAKKVTVTKDDDSNAWPTATFRFKGTGFDVISLTDNTSGAIFVTVKNEKGETVKNKFVNNYYGYTYTDGKWEVTGSNDLNALYQIPVMKITDLKYGEYTAEIKVAYASLFDMKKTGSYSFWLDAVRIYNPAGQTLNDSYALDGEESPDYKKIRDILVETDAFNNGSDEVTGAVFIDGKGGTDVSMADYANQGPNNEVYLEETQGIAFKLVTDNKDAVKTVQIGAKLAKGTSGTLYSNAFSGDKQLTTATDMYYKLDNLTWTAASNGKYESNVITFKNNSGGIISLTNVKVTGGAKIVTDAAAATNNYVMLMASPAIAKEAADIINNAPSTGGSSLPSVKPGSEDTPLPELPKIISVKADKSVIGKGSKAVIRITVSENTEYITVNDELVTDFTVVEKNGVKYKVFTYKNTEKVKGNKEYTVVAYGSDNLSGKQETAMVKVTVFKPGKFTVSVKAKKVKKNQKASLTVKTSKNTKYITVNGKKITKYTKQGKYKVWKYSKKYTKTGTKSFKVVAYDSKKIPSDTKKAVVKVVR